MKRVKLYEINMSGTTNGTILCSAMVDGRYVSRRYVFYTKREARRLFYDYVNSEEV